MAVTLKCQARGAQPSFWSWRAVLLSLLLLPLNLYWIGVTEGVWHALHMTTLSLPMNALMLLLALVTVNRVLTRFRPAWVLDRREVLLIYLGLTVQSVLIGHDAMQSLLGVIPAAAWYATPAATSTWRPATPCS